MKNTATIATKVTIETQEALDELAKQNGVTVYEIVLNAITMILRLGGKEVRLSQTLLENWTSFEQVWGSQSVASLSTLKQEQLEIQDAIYRVTQKGKKRAMLVHMKRPFFGQPAVSQNSENIVELCIKTSYPSTWNVLETIRQDNSLPSIMNVISWLISQYQAEELEKEINAQFTDNDRADNGRSVRQQKYKRHNRRNIDEQRSQLHNANLFTEVESVEPKTEE